MAEMEGLGVDSDGNMGEQARIEVQVGISKLAMAVSNTAHSHGWWSDDDGNLLDRNMGEMIALMHSELSEALEAHRDGEPPLWYSYVLAGGQETSPRYSLAQKRIDHSGELGKPCGVASEFADTIIRILDTCHTLDIPIAQALLDKNAYNISRPYRHGGKAC
jgi:hypothetical protein